MDASAQTATPPPSTALRLIRHIVGVSALLAASPYNGVLGVWWVDWLRGVASVLAICAVIWALYALFFTARAKKHWPRSIIILLWVFSALVIFGQWQEVLDAKKRQAAVPTEKEPAQQWASPTPPPTTKPEAPNPAPTPEPSAGQQHYRAIHGAHPDASAIVDTAEFKQWLAGAGTQWRNTLERGTAEQVIAMFSAYKVYEQRLAQAQEAKRAAEIRRQEQVKQQQEQAKRQQIHDELQAAADRAVERFPFLNEPKYAHVLKQIIETRDQLIAQGVHPPLALTRAVNDHAYAHDPRGQKLPIVEVGK